MFGGVNPYLKEETEDEDIHMAFDEGATQVAGTEQEEARDRQRCQLRLTFNEHCTDMSDLNVPLTRCYWYQSALLQSECDLPLLGTYAELTRGQFSLQSQLSSRIITLDTIDFTSLQSENPPLLALGAPKAVAKATPSKAAAKAATIDALAAPAAAPEVLEVSLLTPDSALTGSLPAAPNVEHVSHTDEAPSSSAPADGSVPQQSQLPTQDPTPQESVKARAATPSRQLARNPSSEAPAPKYAKGPSEAL